MGWLWFSQGRKSYLRKQACDILLLQRDECNKVAHRRWTRNGPPIFMDCKLLHAMTSWLSLNLCNSVCGRRKQAVSVPEPQDITFPH